MTAQALSISTAEMVSGGEMRILSAANKNQSQTTPPSTQASITFLQVGKSAKGKAIHKPNEATGFSK